MVRAVAALHGFPGVSGVVNFEQSSPNATTNISYEINATTPNSLRGFHIHQYGITDGCLSSGSHYNPFNQTHGLSNSTRRHMGDLGNVRVDSGGYAKGYMLDDLVKLYGETSVLGRTIVIHEGTDDLGRSNSSECKTTGNAGGRAACGMIAYTELKQI
ncbi:superoxide dismutase [Cu-Zn] [Zygosaccharomyces mellis]|uniref:Superoxide dismutase [Cu-Zn] n=1 Tax=Zygosaccharomyces mellis TaxID=42258 RepID=A0A4C2E5T6_9SACH|nr:superoxide dismutase [Cu-Zn] [Zygosaccharomyces mellis]